ncbi:mannose-1-phosphate guanylyltransferase [Pacificimonas flava]|uniref:Mannose-1-phosphate guanylyltransferase n=2 Tax=Pacificimonas TaxID=1960290 RepID=A0A219B4L2_9SPHN|nr:MULTISPECIES: nucleotidyltransferase family protein [Pacificimonas]MBZ6379466.1 nucleotidyltransferase family protein [Pacificimonas aurantium]OWV33340.1 mannose-1-phosphate guanylyltransferase [Pacificimonas flava]
MTAAQETLTLRPRIDAQVPGAAMILSAGLGRRMRPLTATRPKPLIQVRGRPLIDYTLDSLARSGVQRAVINTHYLADQVEAHVGRRRADIEIRLSDERAELLETGGGTKKALDLLDADPFLVTNSDNILVDGPTDSISLLAQRWNPEEMDALLLLVPLMRAHGYAGRGDFRLDRAGRITRRSGQRIAPFVYSGTQIVKRSVFENTPDGKFSFNLIFDRLLEKGRLFGLAHQGDWYHVGTPEAVQATERLLSDE